MSRALFAIPLLQPLQQRIVESRLRIRRPEPEAATRQRRVVSAQLKRPIHVKLQHTALYGGLQRVVRAGGDRVRLLRKHGRRRDGLQAAQHLLDAQLRAAAAVVQKEAVTVVDAERAGDKSGAGRRRAPGDDLHLRLSAVGVQVVLLPRPHLRVT